MSEKASGEEKMRDAVAAIAGPRRWNENRKSWLARTAHHLGITPRTMKAIWYGEITDPEHSGVRKVREAAEQQGRHEATELADRFDRLACALQSAGTSFRGEDIDALIHAARALRGLVGSGIDPGGRDEAAGAAQD